MWCEVCLVFMDFLVVLDCFVVLVYLWIYGLGQQIDNGVYLSLVNVIYYLVERLVGMGGNIDVVIMMVMGQIYENFMKGFNSLVDVFFVFVFIQVRCLVEFVVILVIEKMQIFVKVGVGLLVVILLFVLISRVVLFVVVISEVQKVVGVGFSLDGLK